VTDTTTIAYFITPHGFGHASRAAAVMAAVHAILPGVRFELFTTCPRWIFGDTPETPFGYHPVDTDIGVVQRSPLEEDLGETCRQLDRRLPYAAEHLQDLAGHLKALKSRLVICDVSALGIAAARQAGIPSVLVENFTWDWIYNTYARTVPELGRHGNYLGELISRADLHIQTEPLCRTVGGAIQVSPIARTPRSSPGEIRARLNIPDNAPMVLVSMGGVPDRFDFLNHLAADLDAFIVLPGADRVHISHDRVIALSAHSSFYHPDLVAAADALIGKAGYSTIAEAYFCGVPFGFISRSGFPEAQALETFITRHLPARRISAKAYGNGEWMRSLPELLALPRRQPAKANGAAAAAVAITDLLR
jgi:hypothetical protein